MNKQAYRQGFNEACAYYGVAPEQVLAFTKQAGIGSAAGKAGKMLFKNPKAAVKGVKNVGKIVGKAGLGRVAGSKIGKGIAGIAGAGSKKLEALKTAIREVIGKSSDRLYSANPLGHLADKIPMKANWLNNSAGGSLLQYGAGGAAAAGAGVGAKSIYDRYND